MPRDVWIWCVQSFGFRETRRMAMQLSDPGEARNRIVVGLPSVDSKTDPIVKLLNYMFSY